MRSVHAYNSDLLDSKRMLARMRTNIKKVAVQIEKKLNGLVVEGCLDKQMIIIA